MKNILKYSLVALSVVTGCYGDMCINGSRIADNTENNIPGISTGRLNNKTVYFIDNTFKSKESIEFKDCYCINLSKDAYVSNWLFEQSGFFNFGGCNYKELKLIGAGSILYNFTGAVLGGTLKNDIGEIDEFHEASQIISDFVASYANGIYCQLNGKVNASSVGTKGNVTIDFGESCHVDIEFGAFHENTQLNFKDKSNVSFGKDSYCYNAIGTIPSNLTILDPSKPGTGKTPQNLIKLGQKQVGMCNIGNTCYANSVIQLLRACAPLREKMIKNKNNGIINDFYEFLRDIDTGNGSNYGFIWNLWKNLAAMRRSCALIPDGNTDWNRQQQDAADFLDAIFNILESNGLKLSDVCKFTEDLTTTKKIINDKLFRDFIESEKKQGKEGDYTKDSKALSEDFLLKLVIEKDKDVQSLINKYKVVDITKPYEWQQITKTATLKKVSPVLFVQLKRFKYDRVKRQKLKNDANVKINKIISLDESDNNRYKFKGAACHAGSTADDGHYVAIIADQNDDLIKYNDTSVNKLIDSDAVAFFENGKLGSLVSYVLMYEKM